MERVLQGIPRVICYLDNILITGNDDQELLTNLEAVLKRLQDVLRLKTKQVPVDADQSGIFGLLHTSTRTQYLPSENSSNQGSTSTTQELKSFLGLVNYYGCFVKNLSMTCRPLNRLLRKSQPWKWSKECRDLTS